MYKENFKYIEAKKITLIVSLIVVSLIFVLSH